MISSYAGGRSGLDAVIVAECTASVMLSATARGLRGLVRQSGLPVYVYADDSGSIDLDAHKESHASMVVAISDIQYPLGCRFSYFLPNVRKTSAVMEYGAPHDQALEHKPCRTA